MRQMDNCKGCSKSVRASFDDIRANIKEYILMINPDDCVSDDIYQKRLNICNNCPDLYYDATCRYCGCFVQIRAKRKDRNCPYPGQRKW